MTDHATRPPTAPPPIRRLLWTRRLTIGVGLLLVVAGAARFWAGRAANERYARHTETLIAAGYLDASGQTAERPWVDPLKNKVTYFDRANNAWPLVNGLRLDLSDWWHEGGAFYDDNAYPDPVRDNAAYLAALGPLFAEHQHMAEAEQTSWGMGATSRWSAIRWHTRLLEDAANRAIQVGDPTLATRLARVIFETGQLFDYPGASGTDALFMGYARSIAAELAGDLLVNLNADLPLSDEERVSLESLQSMLLDEERYIALMARGFQGNNHEYRQYVEGLRDGSISYEHYGSSA